jgi:acylphosphatase
LISNTIVGIPVHMERVHLIIHGMVQGVFFRAHTREIGERLGLAGRAVNRPDGTVEAVAEGPRDRLEEFVQWCHRGPDMARVDRVEVSWEEATGKLSGFHIG